MGILDFFRSRPSQSDLAADLAAEEYDQFIRDLTLSGSMGPIEVGLSLQKDEFAYLETPASLHEARSVSLYTNSGRVGLRVMKGVYVASGSSGRSESHQELKLINEGVLTITNKRLVFVGTTENRVIPMDKIISVQQLTDAIAVSSVTRSKTMYFVVSNPMIWITVYQLVSRTGAFGATVIE